MAVSAAITAVIAAGNRLKDAIDRHEALQTDVARVQGNLADKQADLLSQQAEVIAARRALKQAVNALQDV
jgi:hypothetical protein